MYAVIFSSKEQLTLLIASFVPSVLLCLFVTWEYFTPSPMPPAEQYNSVIVLGFILAGNYFASPVLMLGFSNSIAQEFPLLKIKNMRRIQILVVLLYVASGMMLLGWSSFWGNYVVPSFLNTLLIQGLIVLFPNALSALLILRTVRRKRPDQ